MGHFHILVALLIAAAVAHIALMKERTVRRAGELALLYLLVGYCGVPMLAFAGVSLVHPHEVAESLGFPPDNPFQQFVSVAMLAMAIPAVMALRYRGCFLVGPAVTWAVFFAGATFIHTGDFASHGALSHGSLVLIFATHGLISVLLLAALIASRAWRDRPGGAR